MAAKVVAVIVLLGGLYLFFVILSHLLPSF
jgi:hypothetical protein